MRTREDMRGRMLDRDCYRAKVSKCEGEFDYDSAENNFGAMYNFAEKVKHDGCEPIVIEETQRILVEGINR